MLLRESFAIIIIIYYLGSSTAVLYYYIQIYSILSTHTVVYNIYCISLITPFHYCTQYNTVLYAHNKKQVI